MQSLERVRPGLYRWTAMHPESERDPEPESPADWPPEVGCALYEAPTATVFFDPLVPDGLWSELDSRVEQRGLPVHVLTTVPWHARSREEVIGRYEGSTSAPEGCEPIPLSGLDETLYWIPEHAALAVGDRLLGDREGGLRLCPASWLEYLEGPTLDDLRTALKPLLDLPVEIVLVSHGDPVIGNGASAIRRALE